MKKFSLIILAASLAGCGGGNSGTDLSSAGNTALAPSASTASNTSSTSSTSSAAIDSTQFLVDAYRDGLGEIRLSQLALQKSSNVDVKAFAQAMIDQHTAVNEELTRLAQNKNITLPTDLSPDQNNDVTRLSSLTGDAFDRAYMELNVTVHEKDVAAFHQQAQQGTDADVRKLADVVLPLLKIHLAVAEDINSLLDPNAFLRTAYQDGLAEIQLSRLALQKSTNTDVKNFAQRMVDEHTTVNNQIATLAQNRGLSLPTALSPSRQSLVDKLSSLSGTDFDAAYMDVNVVVHIKDVRLFRRQSEAGTNADVKSFAQSVLPSLSEHLTLAESIDKAIHPNFFYHAYLNGNTELVLAQWALLRSTNNNVRAFAQRIIDNSSKLNDQLKTLAQEKNVTLPDELSPEQALDLLRLLRLSGEDFDRAYTTYNRTIHDVNITQSTQQSLQDADAVLTSLTQSSIPGLNTHLARVQALIHQLASGSQ